MDDLRMIDTLLAKPAPSADVTAGGRERLRAVVAEAGTARRRRLTWRVAAPVAALAAAAAGVVAVADGSPTATPNGPPAATVSGRQVLLAAAVSAAKRPAGAGTYWHVKYVQSDERGQDIFETWTRRDGREYARNGSGRPAAAGGPATAFTFMEGPDLTFGQLQELPTDPDALKAMITKRIRTYTDKAVLGHVVGPGEDPMLIDTLTGMLARVPVPPKVRAAGFRAIASLPGVSRVGSAPGGQVLVIHGKYGDERLVVDPVTSRVRGWTITPPSPLPSPGAWMGKQSVSVPVAGWTSTPPPGVR